jgi:hypothetical protein
MYNITAHASGGNEDQMVGCFPLVMGKALLLWQDNLPAECITSWATLFRLFTTNYQATYNRPGKMLTVDFGTPSYKLPSRFAHI